MSRRICGVIIILSKLKHLDVVNGYLKNEGQTSDWQWWDSNPRPLTDWSLNPAPSTTRPHYLIGKRFVTATFKDLSSISQ